MSYQVLARKWRPKSFSEVVGQEHVLKVLSNALSLGRVHHAYLFSGTRGVGKTSIARLLAKGLNCESGITATPCGVCDNCRDIEQGRFVDLLEIDAASRTKVEDTREILDNIQYLPTKGRFKVYLIDEVHMLSRSSFNALLKTLEEPPEHVKFLLATTDPQKLPITILSRCLHLHLSALDNELIKQQLIKILQTEKIEAEDKAVTLLAKAANGSVRDALSLTDQAIALGNGQVNTESVSEMLGTLDKAVPFTLVEALYKGDGQTLMQQIELSAKQGVNWDSLLTETISLLHQISFLQIVPTAIGDYSDFEDRICYLAQHVPPNDIQLFYQILLTGRKDLAYAPDKKVGIEMSFLRALAFVPKSIDIAVTSVSKEGVNLSSQPTIQADSATTSPTNKVSATTPSKNTANSSIDSKIQQQAPKASQEEPPTVKTKNNEPETPVLDGMSDLTKNILAARQKIIDKDKTIKKSERVERSQPQLKSQLEHQSQSVQAKPEVKPTISQVVKYEKDNNDESTHLESIDETAETYQWQFSEHFTPNNDAKLDAKTLRLALEHEKTPELTQKLIQESIEIDSWSAEIEQLVLPPLIKQIALNAFIEQMADGEITLHLRSSLSHLAKSQGNATRLSQILSEKREKQTQVNIIIDDDKSQLTPLEVREKIYQTKLEQAKLNIYQDNKAAMICQFFEAKIDDESIRPV